ncbi:hypothetical protein PHSC3_000931 [Chlamydiales bacterium STE3]|nr:hypothetical protein PHSC3_000931 [Chlamydiales bacterium STE3]
MIQLGFINTIQVKDEKNYWNFLQSVNIYGTLPLLIAILQLSEELFVMPSMTFAELRRILVEIS